MNRFIIVDGLPYLYHQGKAYTVRWNEKGFTVGNKVKVKIPKEIYTELSVKAKCKTLDSIGKSSENDVKTEESVT